MKSWENSSSVFLCMGDKIIQLCILHCLFFYSNSFPFLSQDLITVFNLKKKVLFSAIFDPQVGLCTYTFICTLLNLPHYLYSTLTMNLENRKHKFHAFLSPNLKQIDAASFDIQKNRNLFWERAQNIYIFFQVFLKCFALISVNIMPWQTMSNLGSKDLGSSLCSVCS